jgi:hypothetical protein
MHTAWYPQAAKLARLALQAMTDKVHCWEARCSPTLCAAALTATNDTYHA